MREFTTQLRDFTQQGLRSGTDGLRDSDRLITAVNLRPYETGLRLQQVP